MAPDPNSFFDGKFLKRRIQTDFQRTLSKEPSAERVDCPDENPIDVIESPRKPLSQQIITPTTRFLSDPVFETDLETLSQLRSSFSCERDGRNFLDRGLSGPDQRNHARNQLGSLARAGPGLHEEIHLEVDRDAFARGRVVKRQ
jgi:hypothetical protein